MVESTSGPPAVPHPTIVEPVMTEQQLRDKLRKITALFEGAATLGEREAAAAAMERLGQALNAAVKTQPLPETKFSMADQWQRRLFTALCRRYGIEPYRYKGQRYTTVMARTAVLCGPYTLAGVPRTAGGSALVSQRSHGKDYSGGGLRGRGRGGGTVRITVTRTIPRKRQITRRLCSRKAPVHGGLNSRKTRSNEG